MKIIIRPQIQHGIMHRVTLSKCCFSKLILFEEPDESLKSVHTLGRPLVIHTTDKNQTPVRSRFCQILTHKTNFVLTSKNVKFISEMNLTYKITTTKNHNLATSYE